MKQTKHDFLDHFIYELFTRRKLSSNGQTDCSPPNVEHASDCRFCSSLLALALRCRISFFFFEFDIPVQQFAVTLAKRIRDFTTILHVCLLLRDRGRGCSVDLLH